MLWMQLMISYSDQPVGGESAGLQYTLSYIDTAGAYLFAVLPS